MAKIDDEQEREAFAAELIDRFGPLPVEVEHLLRVMHIKALCKLAGVEKADAGPKGTVITFRKSAFNNPAGLVQMMAQNPQAYKLRPDQKLVVRGVWPQSEQRLRGLEQAMQKLSTMAQSGPNA